MSLGTFKKLLDEWEHHAGIEAGKVSREISYLASDDVRIKALAEVYTLPVEEVMAGLLHQAINEIEEKMPYIPGDKVIRVEEGVEIFEDVGPMARYLQIKNRLLEQKPDHD